MAFDQAGDGVNSIGNTFLDTADGSTLYQDPAGTDILPPNYAPSISNTLEWDSYVSGGNLRGDSRTLTDPSFHFTSTGLDDPAFGFGSGWLAIGGWTDPEPELIARAPGSTDLNGNVVVPASFDDAYLYSFQGQLTVLGLDVEQADPVFDGGYIHSDYFNGEMLMSWSRDIAPSHYLQFVNLNIGATPLLPAPGAATGLGLLAFAARRRR